MKGYNRLRKKALLVLNTQLSKHLYYHGVHHTLNALKICESYLKFENIKGEEAKLVRLGIIFHDIGFTVSAEDHESQGVIIAKKLMTEYGFSLAHIKIVKDLILATKTPQNPKNKLEKIVCDVDLDYLGGPHYYKITHQLFKELNSFSKGTSKTEWLKIQIKFLENHKYHTPFAIKYRQPEKEKRLEELIAKLVNN